MNKKLIALGVSAASAATLAFGAVGPATADTPAPTKAFTDAVCGVLPAQSTDLATQLASIVSSITSIDTDLTTKTTALNAATTDLVGAVVSYIQVLDTNGNVGAAAQVLAGRSSVFADRVVAANTAMTASFDAQRNQFITQVVQGYVSGVQTGLSCSS